MEKIITETNQWIQYGGCGVFIPEGYNGPLDVIVYGPGAGGGGNIDKMSADTIPYQELAKSNPNKIIIYDNGIGTPNIDDIVDALKEIDEDDNISVGAIDINVHSAGDKGGITGAIALNQAGFTVANVNVFDEDSTFKNFYGPRDPNSLQRETWDQFATTGASLNVFSRGADGYEEDEHKRLAWAAESGFPVTYTLCEFDKNGYNWGEKHAAINRDLIVNGIMSVIDGTSNTMSFDKRLTSSDYQGVAQNAYYVTGFKYADVYDPETKQWTPIYTREANGDDITSIATALSRNASIYAGGAAAASLIGYGTNSLVNLSTGDIVFDSSSAIADLPSSSNLLVYKDELSAFLSSSALTSLSEDINDAVKLNTSIAEFVGNGVLVGDMWNLAYQKLGIYDNVLNERIQTANALGAALKSAVSQLHACMGEYSKLDTSELGKLERFSDRLQSQIDILKGNLYDFYGVTSEAERARRSEFNAGINRQISSVESQKLEIDKEIDAIKLLKETYKSVLPQLMEALENVNSFSSTVANIAPSEIYTYTA